MIQLSIIITLLAIYLSLVLAVWLIPDKTLTMEEYMKALTAQELRKRKVAEQVSNYKKFKAEMEQYTSSDPITYSLNTVRLILKAARLMLEDKLSLQQMNFAVAKLKERP